MPTSSYPTLARGPQILYSDPKLGNDSYVTYTVKHLSITRPATTYRKRPTDLFRNGTARSWVEERYIIHSAAVSTYKLGRDKYQYNYGYGITPLVAATLAPETSALKSKILSSIKGQKLDLPVMAAELGKTTDMFFGLCRDVIRGFRELKKLRKRALSALRNAARATTRKGYWLRLYSKLTRRLSNRWLEYAMGWKPAMNDIWELSQALQAPHREGDRSVRASVQSERRYTAPRETWSGPVTVHERVSSRAQARFTIESRVISRAQQLGLTNPASSAWELIPFSFVIDYLVDVGEFLGNLDALVGVSNAWWQTGTLTEITCYGVYKPTGVTQNGYSERSKKTLTRSGAAPLTWSGTLTVDGRISAPRTANMVALLRQQMRF